MDNKQPVKEHAGAPSPCQLTLTEFTAQKDDFNITMGDIFGTANELVYIPLPSAGTDHQTASAGSKSCCSKTAAGENRRMFSSILRNCVSTSSAGMPAGA